MDLGIAGRKAIVCASSKGLGRGCAHRLAEAGCEVVINGRNKEQLEATAEELRKATGAKIIAVAADVASPDGQKALFAACPEPDILVNNNAGPPFRDFRDLDRQKMIDGVIANMIVAVELVQKAIDPMVRKKFGRIVNITSGSVKMPLFELDTTFERKKKGVSYDVSLAESIDSVPAKRLGTADEFGATCAFLCSDQAGYITGQNFLIDGGRFPGAF